MEYPDYKYRPKKRQKSGGQVNQVNNISSSAVRSTSTVNIKRESDSETECPDSPIKKFRHSPGFKEEPNLVLDPPSPSYTFPNNNNYFHQLTTPPPKVPSSPEMVSIAVPGFYFVLSSRRYLKNLFKVKCRVDVIKVTIELYKITKYQSIR